jgi:hypothetical protein
MRSRVPSKLQIWIRWRSLVNMTAPELKGFLAEHGLEAGLSRQQAAALGVRSGRDSAQALLKMLPRGESFYDADRKWTAGEWDWAKRQNNFIARMSGNQGKLRKPDGTLTRKALALMLWGHNPFRG